MKNTRDAILFWRLLIPLVLIPLLGISPLPHQVEHELQQAKRASEQGSSWTITSSLESIAQHMPWRTDLWEQAGLFALQSGDAKTAIKYLELTATRHKLSPSSQIALGDAYQKNGDLPAAILAWQAANPSVEASARLVQTHHNIKDYPALIEDYKTLIALQPGESQNYYQLGLALAATQPASASAYLTQAVNLDPQLKAHNQVIQRAIDASRLEDEPAYMFLLVGRALASVDEWEFASQAFRQATLLRPDYAEAWAFLGEAQQHIVQDAGDQESGLAKLEKALQLDPKSVTANTLLALYWQRQNNYDKALVYLRSAAEIDDRNPILQTELGKTTASLGDLTGAEAYYQQAVELAPTDPTYWQILAEFAINNQVHIRETALPAARKAIILSPNDPHSLDLMGQTLYLLHDYGGAERFLRRALQVKPDYAPAHLHLGMNYLFLKNPEDAHQELNLVCALAPETPLATQARSLIQQFFP